MQISIFTILPHWDTRGNSFVGLGVGLIGFFTLSRDVNLRDTEFLSYVIRLASRRTESPRFIYFQINSIYFLNTCTCVINSLDHQRKPNEMQTISGVASVLTTPLSANGKTNASKSFTNPRAQTSSNKHQNWVWNCCHSWSCWSDGSFNEMRDKGSNYDVFYYIYAYSFNVFCDTKEVIKKHRSIQSHKLWSKLRPLAGHWPWRRSKSTFSLLYPQKNYECTIGE